MCFYFDATAQPVRIREGEETLDGWGEDGKRRRGHGNKIWGGGCSFKRGDREIRWLGGVRSGVLVQLA